jgi:hypothetical protein
MKNLYLSLSLIITILSLTIKAQSPVYFDPAACEATVNPNDSIEVYSVLHNATDDTVEFFFPGYTSRGQGGPDSYGYSWIDSDEDGGPNWEWTDISETGTLIEGLGDDNVIGPFEMPFNFPFYGQPKNHFWVSANGCISFNEQFLTFVNSPIPTNSNYIDFIAWFWDDLMIDTEISRVYYQNYEEKTVVQFTKMVHYPGSESFITGQVIMTVNGAIFIRYRMVSQDFETTSATVGLQSGNPEMGLQVAYNQEYVHSEMAVRFDLHRNFITTVHPATLTLMPGTQEHIWITYSSVGFEPGTYEQELQCNTSLHDLAPQIFLHNVMHVANTEQAGFKGYVTDAATGYAINDVQVLVGDHNVYTNGNGYYELPLDAGSYNVHFVREGYQSVIVEDTTAVAGFSLLDVQMEPNSVYVLAGRVYAGDNFIESGFAYGYKLVEGTVVDIYADMVDAEGHYAFDGLAAGHYIVKAEPSPSSIYYGDYLPTYYGDVLHWEDAAIIELNGSTDGKHIHLIPVTNAPEGPGSISGTITGSDSSANIPIILRTADKQTAIMTYSSTDGSYSFTNLAYGTYEVFAEIMGKSVVPKPVVLDETSPSAEGIDMSILENEIIFGIEESDVFENVPVIYPNPVKDMINVMIDLKKPSLVNIDITDPAGRIVYNESYNITDQKNIKIDVKTLPRGIYFLRFGANGEMISKKIIK